MRAHEAHKLGSWLALGLLLSSPLSARAEASHEEPVLCPAHCVPLDEGSSTFESESESEPAPLDLNKADESALLELPGIGPARARAILEFRKSHGAFRSLSQLLHIKGIGRALLKRLRPLVKL